MFGSGSEGRGRFVIICPDEKEARFLRFVGVSGNRLKGTVNGCGGSLLDIRLNLCVDGVNVVDDDDDGGGCFMCSFFRFNAARIQIDESSG